MTSEKARGWAMYQLGKAYGKLHDIIEMVAELPVEPTGEQKTKLDMHLDDLIEDLNLARTKIGDMVPNDGD